MGIDLISEPVITRWSLKSENIVTDNQILHTFNEELAIIETGERQTSTGDFLSWQMTLPLAKPKIELTPFFTDWSKSQIHPTDKLQHECSLLNISFFSSESTSHSVFDKLFGRKAIMPSSQTRIQITIQTPKGIFTI